MALPGLPQIDGLPPFPVKKSFASKYDFIKRFVNNSTTAAGSGNNGVTALDDPTYLGFSLMFDITSPLFNGATLGNVAAKAIDPESPLGKINSAVSKGIGQLEGKIFSPDKETGLPGGHLGVPLEAGPTAPATYPNEPSAIGYLTKIGEVNRANYLRAFVQGMEEIIKTRPYYFQTISGLVEAWNKSIEFSEDPFTGTTGTDGVEVGCLEAIDLKITALFNLYRLAVYDIRMKRFVLPKNLMRFDVYVDVHEIRKFKTVRNWISALNPSDTSGDAINFVNENTSRIRFRFTDCIWDVSASGKVFEGVTNVGGTVATTSMKWSYGLLAMDSQYSGYDSALDESKQQGNSDPGFIDKLKTFGKDAAINAGANAAAKAANAIGQKIKSAAQSLALGNVFGLRNQVLGVLSNPQSLLNATNGAAAQTGELATFGGSTANTSLGDNPLGDGVSPSRTIHNERVFDPSTNSLGGLNSISAFGPSGPSQDNGGLSSTNIFE